MPALPDAYFEPLALKFYEAVARGAVADLMDEAESPIILAALTKRDLDVSYRPINLAHDRELMALFGALPSEVWA